MWKYEDKLLSAFAKYTSGDVEVDVLGLKVNDEIIFCRR